MQQTDETIDLSHIASTQKRIGSFIVDDLVVSLLFIVIFFEQLGTLRTPEDATLFITDNYMTLIVLKVIYHTLFTWQNGMTLGKHLTKIRTVSINNGETLSFGMALLRSMVRVLNEAFFYIGFLPAFFSPTRQTLHDRLSGSVVVYA